MKNNLLGINIILISAFILPQDYEVSGTVLDATSNSPLPGVVVKKHNPKCFIRY
jgi:hypothetical protein